MSLQFLKLVLHNYGQFEHEEIILPEGLISLVGDNGSGKTTIFGSIPFGFYGEAPDRKMEDLMYFNAPPRSHCYVEIYFILNNHRYKLVRDLKRKNNTYLALDNGKIIVDGKREVTEHVKNKLLKMDYDTFCNAFYAKQKEVAALTKMKPSERVETITYLLRFQAFDVAAEMKKREISKLEEEIGKLQRNNVDEVMTNQFINEHLEQIAQIGQEIQMIEEQLKNEQFSFEQLTKEKETSDLSFQSFVRIKESMDSTQKQIVMNETRNLTPNEQKLTNLLSKQEKVNEMEGSKEKVDTLSKERDDLLSLKSKYDQKVLIYRDLKNIKEAFDKDKHHSTSISNQLSTLVNPKIEIEKVENEKYSLQSKIEQTRETIHQEEMQFHELTNKLKEKNEQKKTFLSLGKNSPCPTCSQMLGEKYDQEIEKIDLFMSENKPLWEKKKAEIASLKNHFSALQHSFQTNEQTLRQLQQTFNQYEKLSSNLEIINQELKRKKQEFDSRRAEYEPYKDIQFDNNHLHQVETSLVNYQNQYREYINIQAEVKQIPELQDFIEETKSIISSLKDDWTRYQQQLVDLNFDEEKYRLLNQQITSMQQSISSKKEQIHIHQLNVKTYEQKIETLKEHLRNNQENNRRINQLTKQHYVKKLLVNAYKECKLKVLEQIAPILSGEMSSDIKQLTDSRYDYVELDKTFLPYMEKDGKLKPISFFSGGEESVLAISLRLAISKLLVESTGQELDFLALDEVFAFLDHRRVDNVARMLGEMSKNLSQVLVITHEDHIKDFTDHTLEVRLTPKGNSVTKWVKKQGRKNSDEQFERVQQILETYVI